MHGSMLVTAQRRILSEVPLDVASLKGELMAIQNMLPLAPGTRPEVLARCGNAMGGRRDDVMHYAGDHPPATPTIPHDSRKNTLARNSPEHVDAPVLEVGETVAERAYLVEELQLRKLRWLVVGPFGGHLIDCSRGTQGIRAFPLGALFPLWRRLGCTGVCRKVGLAGLCLRHVRVYLRCRGGCVTQQFLHDSQVRAAL